MKMSEKLRAKAQRCYDLAMDRDGSLSDEALIVEALLFFRQELTIAAERREDKEFAHEPHD